MKFASIASPSLARRISFLALASVVFAGCARSAPPAPEAAPTPAVAAAQPPAPIPSKTIYSDTANAKADIAAAEASAKKHHRNILVDFGGNWCGDCQVLDIYMHQSPNQELIAKNFEVVHVNIGRYDKNLDVAAKYGIPLKKGVPALAVLDARGKTLYTQQTGEFENMRHMDPASVTDFLNKWKPAA